MAARAVLQALTELDPLLDNLLAELVRIPSVSPTYPGVPDGAWADQEARVVDVLGDIYTQAHANPRIVAVDPSRPNVSASLGGSRPGKSLVFNGHVDVVPPGPESDWSNSPFSGHISRGRLHGRGSVDQKAGLAAQAVAALAISRSGVRLAGRLDLQAVVGEETGEHDLGTRALLREGPLPDAAVVSEPSPDRYGHIGLGVTSPGLTRFVLRTHGRRAHGTTRGPSLQKPHPGPDDGVNAIDAGFTVYRALRRLEHEWVDTKQHPHFLPGAFAIAPAVISGQSALHPTGSIVPDEFALTYSVIHHPDDPLRTVRAEIEEAARTAIAADPWASAAAPHLDWSDFSWAPLITENSPLVDSIIATARSLGDAAPAVRSLQPTAGFGVTDATLFQEAGVPAVTLGPGSGPGHSCRAHAANEWVDLQQMHDIARLYALLALDWCGTID